MWQGNPYMEALRGSMNVKDGVGHPRVLEVPELWDVSQGVLHVGSGTNSREKRAVINEAGRAEPSKPFDIRYGAAGFGVCPAGQ